MMLKQQILEDLKSAMREGNAEKRDTLRMLDSMVKNTEIDKKKREEGLSDEEVQEVVMKAIKQRKDAIAQYVEGGREELADKEKKEIEFLSAYMPSQLSEDEVRKIVQETIAEAGDSDMGKMMGAAMAKLKGKADGAVVRKIVEEELKK
ncbi:MAG: GatB/YqeY domain-containing protein [Candidatus Moranbacteria bacterium]|nr:GatB/YqeY domain-containing protein [Candidatus Moranbacteria bacterium]